MKFRLPFTLVFVAFALCLLLGPLHPYLLETGALTPFYATGVSWGEFLGHPRQLLLYVASGLQSCFALPWLGATLFTALLVALAYAQRWAFRVSDAWFGLCWVVPFLLFAHFTQMGYLLYTTKAVAPAYVPVLEVLLGVLLLGCLRVGASRWRKGWKSSLDATGSKRIVRLVVSTVLFVGSAIAAYTYTFRDPNFLNTLRMKHAAEDGAWNQVLQIARDGDQEPTRAQVCLTRLALFKTGRMGDELFTYPEGAAAYEAPQNQWLRLMIGPLLYYHYGKTGFAYRWAMEDLVEYGERPAYLRYLHSVARLNGEDALAQRYERSLARTLFYKDACEREEQEAAAIKPLLNYTDQLDGDNGLVEFYLLNSFALSEGGSREMVELSLMDGLITKNLTGFWPRFMALLPTWQGHIPTHYQEAALMLTQLQGGLPLRDLSMIDPAIQQRFQRLVEASARMGDNAANAAALRPEFGNTYWYYYFFVEGLKTN